MTNEALAQIGHRNMYLLISILVMVSAQVLLGLVLFGRILAILSRANGLLTMASSHGKMTDQTVKGAAVAVKELREDVKIATLVAKDVAVETAEKAKNQMEEAVTRVLTGLDSFRPPSEPTKYSKIGNQ